ncbi:uncharacterized protein [Montipora foliosa]|uniref:uncharacterized protein n=1 Tax=Montipora foliosa TaxID=591990 RepID=UPI0035F2131D
MEALTSELDVQLKLLKFAQGKTKAIVEKANREGIERHRDALRAIVKKVESVKMKIEQAKLESGVQVDELTEWSAAVEAQQETADEEITHLSDRLVQMNYKTRMQAKESEEELAERDRQKQLAFERTQLEMRLTYEKKIEETKQAKTTEPASTQAAKTAKLPKLVITKFRGDLTDWPQFWSQFETKIDKAEIAGVTKYSYLKELVDPKIRTEIDGLPFSSEGYERAKNILTRKYGQTSEVVNAYVENIMSLPTIGGTQPARIHDFYEKLLFNVQSLETMGKLQEVNGYVRMTIDKLSGIRGDLVRTDDSWREWNFPKLVDELRKWTERNPIQLKQSDKPWRDKNFQIQQDRDGRNQGCVYCGKQEHKSVDCKTVVTVDDRKKVLSNKRLCFNCTGSKHRAEDCKSRSLCQICQRRHHTSICNSVSNQLMTAATMERQTVIYPVVVVEVLGVKCRALLDTGAGSSYAPAALLDRLKIRPHQREVQQIEMMMGVVTKPVEIFKVQIRSLKGDFLLETDVTLVNKKQLLSLENPHYQQVLERYEHLKGVKTDDMDRKEFLPVHLILGVCDYTKIKTETAPLIGAANEPIAEKTKFGWTIISPGKEVDLSPIFLTQTSTVDYDNLCRLDVLGLADCATGDQEEVYSEFKEQLRRDEEGWYETSLPWKGNHPPLPSNEAGSLRRLTGLVKKLRSKGTIERYDQVIQDQIKTGIVERVSGNWAARILHPPQGSVAVTGDIKQAFLQVRIKEQDCDALRFHWLKDPNSQTVEMLRFTRALFKRGLMIPRLELVSGHMAVNLLANVASALDGFPLMEKYCWLDSTVALHWIRSPGTYKQFVSNRVEKIQAHSEVIWRHVGTSENPADLGSRGGEVLNHPSWCNGPKWLNNKACWPPDIQKSFMESELEIIIVTKASRAPVKKDAVSGSNVISATPNGSNSQQDEDMVITEPYKEGGKNKRRRCPIEKCMFLDLTWIVTLRGTKRQSPTTKSSC